MKTKKETRTKVANYQPKSGWDNKSQTFLNFVEMRHKSSRQPLERVALLSEAVATELGQDARMAFFAGLLQFFGTIFLPNNLSLKSKVTKTEYEAVKDEMWKNYHKIKDVNLFEALVVALIYVFQIKGYSLDIDDFPGWIEPAQARKIMSVTTIVSVCAFIDAYFNSYSDESTKIIKEEDDPTLKELLEAVYPNDHPVVKAALKCMYIVQNKEEDE